MATSKKTRQYVGIIAALAAYYLIHEGAHAVSAICMGVFQKIRFMGIGMQIVVADEQMSDTQLGIFCIVGAVSTLITAWILSLLAGRITTAGDGKSDGIRLFRSCMYYITLAMLLIDPLYLSVRCGFFGGRDMNGIKLLRGAAGSQRTDLLETHTPHLHESLQPAMRTTSLAAAYAESMSSEIRAVTSARAFMASQPEMSHEQQ